MKLYLDTSVLGAVFDSENPRRVEITLALLTLISQDKHIGIVSNVVLEEIERSPKNVKEKLLKQIQSIPLRIISEDEESADLFEAYEKEGFIRKAAKMDLRHLAVATVGLADAVVSWNFRDMVNLQTRRAVQAVNLRLGYPLIEIVSPEEVIEYEE